MKLLTCIFFFVILCAVAYAQEVANFGGLVLDKNGNVSDAVVTLSSVSDKDLIYRATTDNAGEYRIRDVRPGKYVLQATTANRSGVSKAVEVEVRAGQD